MEVIIDVKVDDVGERIVALEGGPPWGFRMHGNCDNDRELQISRVNPGSKASLKGVREGDLITSINGRPTKEITNSEAHTLLKSAGDRLVLGLNEDCQNSPKRRQYKTILHHHRQEVVHETSKTSTSTSHTTLFTTNDPNSSTGKQNTSNNTNGDQVNIDEDTPDGATIPKTNGVVEINEVFEKEAKSSIESTPNVRRTNGLTFANNTNPFRQPVSPGDLDKALESEYENFFEQQEVDETPCVSTATPTPTSAATPTLTPTSSHYSSDTRESNSKQEINSNEVIEDQNGVNIISNTSKEELRKTTNESETIKEEMVIQKVVDITGSKKLLDIIIKEKLNNPEVCVEPTNLMDLTNLEELRRLHEARLNAKDKSEWLQLVRTSPAVPKRQLPRESENWVNDGKNSAKPRTPPKPAPRRRRSLPPELQVKQMQYLIEKEKQIQAQFDYVESEKRKLLNEMLTPRACNVKKTRPTSLPPQEEFRQRMYEEYRRQLAEREERKSQKVIKISLNENEEVLSPAIKMADFNDIQKEFMDIVNERRQQNGNHANHKDSRESSAEKSDNDTVLVLDGVELRAKKVPKHLQEFLSNTGEQNGHSEEYDSGDGDGIWSPGQKSSFDRTELQRESTQLTSQESLRSDDNVAPIWTPKSAGSSPTPERKEFRPVSFESPVLQRKNRTKSDGSANAEPPWNKDINSSVDEKKLPTSQSAPGPGFGADFSPRLPKAQNPTITLLQKAREGQIPPKSAVYIEQDRARRKNESPYNSQNDLIYNLRTESISDSDSERPKRVVHHQEIRDANMTHWYKRMYETIHKHRPSKYDDEEYVTIRYKQRNRARQPFATGYLSEPEAGAYDSDVALSDDKYATLDRRRTNPYGGSSSNVAFQTDPTVYNRYASYSTTTLPNSVNKPKTALKPTSSLRKREEDTTTIRYKPQVQQTQSALQLNKPGKIENYTPGKSSISESEAKKWWDEVMDIFDGWLDDHSAITCPSRMNPYHIARQNAMEKQQLQQQQQRQKVPLVQPKGYLSQALKESGYESDSTLVFRRRDETAQQLNPHEQREVYKIIQKGGDVPLHGLRKVVPDRPKEDTHTEYMPIRSRSSSKDKEREQIVCFPVLTTFDNDTFAAYKRTAPSSLYKRDSTKPVLDDSKKRVSVKPKPPSPPRRKSSRNNSTLRMIHTVKTPKSTKSNSPASSSGTNRHETCFSPIPKPPSSVKSLREKITTKLSPVQVKTEEKMKKRVPLVNKCYCTRSRPCSKCRDKDTKDKSPVEVKKAVMKQISAMNGSNSATILAKINGSRKTPSKLPNKIGGSIAGSRSTLKSTSMDSLKSIKQIKSPKSKSTSKSVLKEDLSKKVLKKTKSKKELLNTQVKSSGKPVKAPSKEVMVEKVAYVPKATELIKQQPEGFFQQLFFGPNYPLKQPSEIIPFVSSVVTRRICDPTLGALKRYLSHTKPVSESRFKYLDMVRSRSSSPKSIQYNDTTHERSISLPPKLIFTQTSRPVTPTFERKRLSVYKPPESPRIEKLIFSQTSRPVSPVVVRRATTPSSIDGSWISSRCPSPSETLYFSETSRPVSPVILQRVPPRPPRPISPVYNPPESPKVIRSPSYRRIKQKRSRPHSTEIMTNRSERFKELNKFYQDLERVGQLERTSSSSDLRPRRKFEEEIIDYDRWQEVRQRERAERELTSLYRQLKQTQEEHDFLFRTKPLCKWRRNLDRGLRIKERSVENLREEFEKIRKDQIENERKLKEELNIKRGVYKSLWRGNSVVNLAHTLNDSQRSQSESRASVRERISENEKLLTHGIGSRIWSSLSMEQVNILKNQLTEIYGSDNRFSKTKTPSLSLPRKNTIEVALDKNKPPRELRVRRNSDTIPSKEHKPIEKSKSATLVGKVMSEEEKMRISQSLSKEILNIHFRNTRDNVIKAKETLGAVAAANAQLSETSSPRTCYSLEMSEDEKRSDYLLVLTKNDSKTYKDSINDTLEVWAKPKPVEPQIKTDCLTLKHQKSETESTSTDGSTKTVIFNDPGAKKDKIKEKVTYFENKDKEEYTPTIYKPSDEPADDLGDTLLFRSNLPRSQSNQDLRELFGESQLNRMATEPLSASRKSKYTRPRSPVLRSLFHRAKSLSPHRNAIKVTDLKKKFEGYYNQRYALPPRRCASDPQLSKLFHDGEKVNELRSKFEYPKISGRGRSRVRKSGLISSACLRAEDRYMPHINIISKIATLYPKTHRKETSRSSENLAKILGIPVGEVHKLRERFDAADKQMSILGHMFTSSPNINELRDVAQYLTGSWYAHKHPKAEEGDVVPRVLIRPKSASPPRHKSKLASILKLPVRRRTPTQNGRRNIQDVLTPFRSWWTPSSAKHSVHFKEPEGPPPPPPSVEHDPETQENNTNVDLNAESPRKYVENEVTIHYRTPVRQEVKEEVDEHVLARQQADAMRKIYEKDRQRKHQQVSSYSDNELLDRRSRRHTDNFTPSQKSPIPLNRYDDFIEEMSSRMKSRPRSPEPRLVARAVYNFVGQSARELTFKKGDVIFVRRQIDKNWYEGELNAMIGLFPSNYVEIVPYEGIKTTTRRANEGQARAKYNFIAQSHLELSLAKGELVVVTRRVDDNWYEGRIGGRKGIFPMSYVEMLVDPQEAPSLPSSKPVASPAAHSMLLNGSSGGKESMGTHNYVPTFPTQDLGMSYRAKPVQITDAGTYGSLKKNPVEQALHIDIQNDPVPYKALYKYRPQNEDELELLEGDVVQVLEKCDDGWFVGTSERTGAFGTFPGNYVEKIN
ncbi:uncharacterized protein [Atheta coriaria]|uniref:uncharacterized protein isoform X2 n=1 Tax=Dalotia coriaria TaxID=877792 RepID=UPI0031F3ADF7